MPNKPSEETHKQPTEGTIVEQPTMVPAMDNPADVQDQPRFIGPSDRQPANHKTALTAAVVIVIFALLLASSGWLSHLPTNLNTWIAAFHTNTTTLDQKVVNEESLVIDVAKKASPSVVSIGASQSLSDFLGNAGDPNQPQGIGTGFIVGANGVILTNKHVVSDTTIKYVVITSDNKKYDVKNIYRDPSQDLAIVKIDATNLTPLELGDSSKLQVGQFVMAIGNALGEFSNSVTTGVVSGLGRGITAGDAGSSFQEKLKNVIQTDAAINPGNSGGSLLNSAGQVIGINTAVSQNAQNIGFAIPINDAKPVIDEFNKTGKIAGPAYLGVAYQAISQRAAILNNVPQGMYITQVGPNSPADKAGLKVGDIITKINDTKMTDNQDLATFIQSLKIGDNIKIEYWRDSKTADANVTLIEAPAQ
jgi:serine protease Do